MKQQQQERSTSSISIDSFSQSEAEEMQLEQFIEAINSNNISLAQSLNCKQWLNKEIINKMNPLHIAIQNGYERMFLWLLSEGANPTLPTGNGYDCLSLAVLQQNLNITQMLISRINPNFISPQGTPLHIAARLDNVEIVKTLVAHPNIILDLEYKGKTPFMVAGKKCRQILKNEIDNHDSFSSFRSSVMNFIRMTQLSQNSMLINKPTLPPIVKGKVVKVNYFRVFQYERYLVLDPKSGVLARYKEEQDCPLNPCQLIPLELIKDVELSSGLWFQRNCYNYLRIIYGSSELYLGLEHLEVARKWKELINKGIAFFLFQRNKIKEYTDNLQAEKIEQAMIADMLSFVSNQITLMDESYLDQFEHIQARLEQNKQIYQGQLDMIQEQSKYEEETIKKSLQIKDLQIFECIGKGSFGFVFRVSYLQQQYALKQQDKAKLINNNNLKYAIAELNILKQTYHPFLVNLVQSFQTPQNLYLLLEYCANGDMAQYITRGVTWSEQKSKYYICQIVLAIEYLHSKNIIYRDLKPENIALDSEYNVKLLDFGLAKEGQGENFEAMSMCGSPAYLAPEVLDEKGACKATDIYCIGLILYEMLTGFPPFYTIDINRLFKDIVQASVRFPASFSFEAKDLLQRMLIKNPKSRIKLEELKKHRFFMDIDWKKVLQKQYKGYILEKKFPTKIKGNQELIDYDYDENGDKNFIINWNYSR